jgi:hypothetical protein
MTTYDTDQIERDDADRAIDTQTDAAAEAVCIEIDTLVSVAIDSAPVLTVMSRGKHYTAELVRRILRESGNGGDRADSIAESVMSGYETDPRIVNMLKRMALSAASAKTPREIELESKLAGANALVDHYARELANCRDPRRKEQAA